MSDLRPKYANWWSKLLFQKKFENQFFIPIPPGAVEHGLMKAIERRKFGGDFSSIPIDRPIFIVGLPRSGTTLLYNLLCAHERAAYVTNSMNAFPDAPCAIDWLCRKLGVNIRGERFFKDSIETDFHSPSEPILFWGKWIGRDVDSLHWQEKRKADFSPEKLQEIYTDVRKVLSCFGGGMGRRWICKYSVFQTELRMIQDLFPDAHFIHIVRDGRETANSLVKLHKMSNDQLKKIKHPTVKSVIPYPRVEKLQEYVSSFGADSVECTAHVWVDSIELVHQVQSELRHFTEIKYEDLVKHPLTELKRIFEFCELPWPEKGNAAFEKEYQGIGLVHHKNDYKGYDQIEEIAGSLLRKYGYL